MAIYEFSYFGIITLMRILSTEKPLKIYSLPALALRSSHKDLQFYEIKYNSGFGFGLDYVVFGTE